MGSKGDDPGIGTFALIYWNHFLEPGLILLHMNNRSVVKNSHPANPRSWSRTRKPQNLVVGKKVNDGILSLRGANLTVSLYVGEIDNSFEVDDICAFVEDQNVKVVELCLLF